MSPAETWPAAATRASEMLRAVAMPAAGMGRAAAMPAAGTGDPAEAAEPLEVAADRARDADPYRRAAAAERGGAARRTTAAASGRPARAGSSARRACFGAGALRALFGSRALRVLWAAALLAALALGPALPAAAQQPALPGLSGQDRNAPIEITADQLVVEQAQRTATFKGEVEAVQGTMRLTADRLVVHYGEDRPEAAAETGSIRRIEAFGRVLVRAPGETAEGERGVYDVAAGTLSLEGSVVLTRGGNVVRGERLEVDLASGRSTLLAASGQGPAGRVRALFVPGGGKGP